MLARRLRPWLAAGLLLAGAASYAPAQEGAAAPAPRPAQRPNASREDEILYRRLALSSFRRYRAQIDEILERLWTSGSPLYCPALARIGDNLKLTGDPGEAVSWYRRAVAECDGPGWALLSLSEIARDEPGLCADAVAALEESLRQAPVARLPGPAAERGWTAEELDYLGLVGANVIRMTCQGARVDSGDLRRIVDYRGRRAFGREAGRVEAYVTGMMLADLHGRAGDEARARDDLLGAVRTACRSDASLDLLVEATRPGTDPRLAFHVGLDAIGLLQALWEAGLIEEVTGRDQRCLRDLLHAVRRRYRDDPAMAYPEVRQWHAELDRALRRDPD